MDVCSFSSLNTEISCGPNRNIAPSSKCLPLYSCHGDIILYLRSCHIAQSSIRTECDLIKARAGLFEDSTHQDDLIICPNHRFYLGKGWRSSRLCMAVEPLQNCSRTHKISKATLSYVQSQQICRKYGILIPVGAGICRQCRENLCGSLKEMISEVRDEEDMPHSPQPNQDDVIVESSLENSTASTILHEEPRSFLELDEIQNYEEKMTDDKLTQNIENINSEYCDSISQYSLSQNSGSIWTPSSSQDMDCNVLKRKALDTFLLACDSSPIKKTLTTNWEDSSKRTKSDYILKAKQICSNVLNVLAPGQGHHLLEAIVQSEKSQDYNLLDDVTAAYKSCTDWGTQRQILSLVATKVAFVKLKTLIPNLSRYKFCAARKHALSFGEGQQVPSAELTREGISTQQISHFLDFLLSPAIITDMPYGETKLKLSNGESINVPKVILNSVRTRVVEQYFSYCEETGFDKKASLSTYMRILHAVGPNVRKSMKGLDNYAADGAKAIENLQKVVELFGRLGQGKEWTENATNVLSVTKQYLKLEYKLHIMKDSEVADHCCKYALSDGTKYYSSACSHSHESSCKQCDDLEMVLENISDISTKIVYDDDDQKDDTVYIVSESVRAVYEWKKHVLRTVNQDMARQLILDELQDTEVLIERDWAMKFIPMMYRESQTNWFGKRGLNWHVTVATFKNESILNSYTIIHIFDSATQDAETSNAVLSNSLEMLHVLKSSLNTAFIRSDNAGCFHGTVSLCAVPNLSVDIHCERVDFADPQGGKSICDRKAAHTKSYIRRYVNEGNDVCTASDFKKAIQSSKMKNVSVVVSLPPTKSTKKFPVIFKLPKVTELNNFSFTHNGTIRVWKQYDIGEGLVIPANGSQLELPKLTIIEQYSSDVTIQYHAGDHAISETSVDNSILSTDFNTDIQLEEEEEEPAEMSRLFCCTECTKTFSRHGNLLRHLDIGTHLVKTENKCLSDKSKVEYSKQIEKLNTTKVNLQNFTAKTSKSKLKEGWALKARREVKRFNKNQTDFLDEKFDKGEKTGQKCDPEDVSQEMRQVKRNSIKRFRQDEFLSATQIASYFSRLVVKKRQSYNPLYTEDDLQAEISATEFQELQEIAK